jgi:hypothetical protein
MIKILTILKEYVINKWRKGGRKVAWEGWYKLNTSGIANAPTKPAVYRIAVEDGYYFNLLLGSKVKKWVLANYSDEAFVNAFNKSGLSRVLRGIKPQIIVTDLVYIGHSDVLERRLNDHYKGVGNEGIKTALEYRLPLYYSYNELKTVEAAERGELSLFSKFVERAQGFCPPFDNNSPECLACNGEAVKAYMIVEGKTKLLC